MEYTDLSKIVWAIKIFGGQTDETIGFAQLLGHVSGLLPKYTPMHRMSASMLSERPCETTNYRILMSGVCLFSVLFSRMNVPRCSC